MCALTLHGKLKSEADVKLLVAYLRLP